MEQNRILAHVVVLISPMHIWSTRGVLQSKAECSFM